MGGASVDHTLIALALVLVTCGTVLTTDCCFSHTVNDKAQTDLAEGACVRMSSQYRCRYGYCFPGSQVVDGIYEPPQSPYCFLPWFCRAEDYVSVATTNSETSPWMQLDLKRTRCVKGVKIWNRNIQGGKILKRFKNAHITVSHTNRTDIPFSDLCKAEVGDQDDAVLYYQCGDVMCGRYVTVVSFNSHTHLNLWEIEVHGW